MLHTSDVSGQVNALKEKNLIRHRIKNCLEQELKGVMPMESSKDSKKCLLSPMTSIKQILYCIDWTYNQYVLRIEAGQAKDKVFFLYGDRFSFHYLVIELSALVTALLAGASKIYIHYSSTPLHVKKEGYDLYLKMFYALEREFPEIVILTPVCEKSIEKYVQEIPEITHFLDFGEVHNHYYVYSKLGDKVKVFTPAFNFVWVNFRDNILLQENMQLNDFGWCCYYGFLSYEAFYNTQMDGLGSIDTYVGIDYEEFTMDQMVLYLRQHYLGKNNWYGDKLLYIFSDNDQAEIDAIRERVGDQMRIINGNDFDIDNIDFDFMQIFE